MFLCKGNRIFGDNRFSSRSVRCNENRISEFQMVNSLFLESVEFERILWYDEVILRLRSSCIKTNHHVRHLGNKLVKVGQGLVDIYDMSPISFLYITSTATSFHRFKVLVLMTDIRAGVNMPRCQNSPSLEVTYQSQSVVPVA
jgi:hypothetical protein